jgi:hypothetical protein
MQTGKIINRKSIVLALDLSVAANNNFDRHIDLQFQPDIMVVKQITYANDGTETDFRMIFCNGIRNGNGDNFNRLIGAFTDKSSITPETIWDVKNTTFPADWNFQVQTVTGSVNATFVGSLYVHLEFVQFQN